MLGLTDFLLKFVSYIVDGLYSVVTFLVSFFEFLSSFLGVLPVELSGVIVLLFCASIFIVIFKAFRSMV